MKRAIGTALWVLLASGCGNSDGPSKPAPTATATATAQAAIAQAATAKTAAAKAMPPSTATLTAEERRAFYHLPEGGEILPLELVRAVESTKTFRPFMENLERFRLIPDPDDPDGLPVGMSAAMVGQQRSEPRMVFVNCAACHMTEITYQGKSLLVEGAPSHFDTAGFVVELLEAFENTLTDSKKLSAFLDRLAAQRKESDLAKAYPDLDLPKEDAKGALPDRVAKLMEKRKSEAKAKAAETKHEIESASDAMALLEEKITYLKRLRGLRTPTFSGFGRVDAFVSARNLLFGDEYAVEVDSPVSLPPIYGLTKLSWYHYDNNTTSIVQRNIGEDLGMGAVADTKTGESTVKLRNLLRLEEIAAKLPVPRWPEELLGKLDAARVAKGKPIYEKECASCHEPAADGTFPDRTVDLATIGTDPNRAKSFAANMGDRPFVDALAGALDLVQKAAMKSENVTPEEVAKLERGPVKWRAPNAYASRPIAGVWATAPYLHNGSVPTLHDLLLPPDKRPKTFQTGSREYDPKKVGYVYDGSHGGEFHFDTEKNGNHNTGHTYGTALSEEDRLDLLEYLKSR